MAAMRQPLTGYLYYPDSLAEAGGVTFCMVRSESGSAKYLGIMGSADGFMDGQATGTGTMLFPLSSENARVLRKRLSWLNPQPLGVQTTAGFGDRLGLATPGHVLAMQEVIGQPGENPGAASRAGSIAPVFAQQSVRENARTHRTPQQVLDDAVWGVFQSGWRLPWGADADHLKTPADLDTFFDAGFTFFTIDPGDHVDNAAQTDPLPRLREKVRDLPWNNLRSSPEDLYRRYLDQTFAIEDFQLSFDESIVLRAAAKYAKAIAHTLAMSDHLVERASGQPFDLEVSVDETEIPTSAEEHFFISTELKRLGIRWTSMAPRFVGRFEKGVDYIGDLAEFEAAFACHAAIAQQFGYRLSLHSGSDKFSIYKTAARCTNGLLHLKTAGTSYLEALRVVAQSDPDLFRHIFHLAIDRYENDRASYHVSASLKKVVDPGEIPDAKLPGLIDEFDARQIFHVTFGATLDRFGPQLLETLRTHEDAYYKTLAGHFIKHLQPLLV